MHTDKLNKLINLWYIITVAILLILGIKYALVVLVPFILAIIVASSLRTPIKILTNKTKLKYSFVSFVCVSLILLLLLGLISLLLYSVYAWLSDFVKQLPSILPSLTAFTEKISNVISVLGEKIPQTLKDNINHIPSNLITSLTTWITDVLSNTATQLPSIFIAVFVTVVASYIITRDYNKLGEFAKSVIPSNTLNKLVQVRKVALNKTLGIIKGYFWLTSITFVELLIGFMLLGVNHSIALAAIIAFIDLLPILGTGIILIPWSVYLLFTGNITLSVGLILLYVITTVVKNMLSPKILGNQIKLDSLCVLISMYIGYKFMGIGGMMIAPFIAAVARDLIIEQ